MTSKSQKSWLRDSLNPGLKSNSQVKKMGDAVELRRGRQAGFPIQPRMAG